MLLKWGFGDAKEGDTTRHARVALKKRKRK